MVKIKFNNNREKKILYGDMIFNFKIENKVFKSYFLCCILLLQERNNNICIYISARTTIDSRGTHRVVDFIC